MTGSIGIPALVTTTTPFVFQRHIAVLKPDPKLVSGDYLTFVLRTQGIGRQALEVATGTAQLTIPLAGLRSFTFSLPPLNEQREIVRRVDGMLALADRVEARYAKAKARCDSLTMSMLSKAFRGELVPTEAELADLEGRSFESAEELLARITATEEPGRRKSASRTRK